MYFLRLLRKITTCHFIANSKHFPEFYTFASVTRISTVIPVLCSMCFKLRLVLHAFGELCY